MRNKIEALNQEISDKNAKVRGLEHRLKNVMILFYYFIELKNNLSIEANELLYI